MDALSAGANRKEESLSNILSDCESQLTTIISLTQQTLQTVKGFGPAEVRSASIGAEAAPPSSLFERAERLRQNLNCLQIDTASILRNL